MRILQRRRITIAVLALTFILAGPLPLAAQQPTASHALLTAAPPADREELPPDLYQPAAGASRPPPLVPLYISFAGMQALDVHSTLLALDNGGREANPVVSRIAGTPAALVAVKAGATIGLVFVSEKLWKRNRMAAVLMMVGLNAGYAAVISHNYAVAKR